MKLMEQSTETITSDEKMTNKMKCCMPYTYLVESISRNKCVYITTGRMLTINV